MEPRRLEIVGREGVSIGTVELMPVGPADGDYKIVIQLERGYQVLALRSEMTSGRISGILGKAAVRQAPAT